MRDRLIELVNEAKEQYFNDVTDRTETDYIVECLLDNGVIFEKDAIEVLRLTTEKIAEKLNDKINKIEHPIGKIVVPLVIKDLIIPAVDKAREEAEQALQKGGEMK